MRDPFSLSTMSLKDLFTAARSSCNFRVTAALLFFISVTIFVFTSLAVLRLTESLLFTSTALFLPQPQSRFLSSSYYRCIGDRVPGNGSWQLTEDDEELMRQAVAVSCAAEYYDRRSGKVAFMFLTRGRMPLMPLWERFFEGQDKGLFSVYRHTLPEYEEELPESSVFFRRRVPSKTVEWGRPTMIDAERRLLANALLDPSNQWLILLSESCIPLFNFTRIYTHLSNSHLSFVGSFDDPRKPGRGRYNRRMSPTVTLQDWRKGSQWFAVHRTLAGDIVSDCTYYPVFRDHCRPPCYMDEHYLPTLVTKRLPRQNSNRSVTWVDWSRGGSHPATYRKWDVTVALVERMRRGGTGCAYNGNASDICFLFARKFHANTLGPLMELATSLMLY